MSRQNQFQNLAEFARAVRNASHRNAIPDARLVRAAATTYGNSDTGSDGGFAVPAAFAENILAALDGEGSLMARCHVIEIGSNRLSLPLDLAPVWEAGGVVANWEGEAAAPFQVKPKLGEAYVPLRRLKALVPITDEFEDDAPALSDYLTWRFGEAVRYKMNSAILSGTGAGMPFGILNSGATITIAKESSQAAGTLLAANVLGMYSRLLSGSQTSAVWAANPDLLKYLASVTLESGAPAYLVGNGQGEAGGYLLGRPVVWTEAAPALGSRGDIVLADLARYLVVVRRRDPSVAHSIHMWFDQGVSAYRLIFRANGLPLLDAPVTPPYSTNTRSICVALDARA